MAHYFWSLEGGVLENLPHRPGREDVALKWILAQSLADGLEELVLVP